MGRPHRVSPARRRWMTLACSACVPCEKFSRATSMPAPARRSSCSALALAGPMVQTILVRVRRISASLAPRAARGGARAGSREELAGEGDVGLRRDLLRRARGHHAAAGVAALGPEVDHPVRRLDDVQVVLDDHHRVALLDEPVQDLQQLLDVGEVEPGGGLVQDVEGAAGGPPGQLGGQLHPLGLAARERGGRLPEADVVEADLVERAQLVADRPERARRSREPRARSWRARRRWTSPCSAPRGSRGCSAGPCTPRTSRRRRAGSASRSSPGRRPGTPRSARP